MKKIFEKFLFLLFLSPVVIAYLIFCFGIKQERIGVYGVNRTINWSVFDKYFSDPIYNGSVFTASSCIYLLAYFSCIILKRRTDYGFSVIHFFSFLLNLFLIFQKPSNYFIIPLVIVNFIFFTLNLVNSKRSLL